jgi:hypothetical protein
MTKGGAGEEDGDEGASLGAAGVLAFAVERGSGGFASGCARQPAASKATSRTRVHWLEGRNMMPRLKDLDGRGRPLQRAARVTAESTTASFR